MTQPTTGAKEPPTPWIDVSPETIVRTVWHKRRLLLLITAGFALLGTVVALLMTPEFASEAQIMPEMNNGSGDVLKRLASVAGFAGLDVSDAENADAVRPDLYPTVLQSTPFVLYLIDQPITPADGQRTTVGALLWSVKGWSFKRLFETDVTDAKPSATVKPGGPVRLSARQQELSEAINERVRAKLDTRSGVISISAKMPDAAAAASVAQLAMDYLTRYVTDYRTEKARQDLLFYTRRLAEARQRYQTAQYNVFHYNDQHKYLVVQAATMAKQRMEAELTISQTVYTELSRQFEQAKLNVQERTPVFKVLEPPKVPLKRTAPKRTVVVLVFAAVGFVLGVLYLLARQSNVAGRLRAMVQTPSN